MDNIDTRIARVLGEHSQLYEGTRNIIQKSLTQAITEEEAEKLEELDKKFDEFYELLRQKYPDLPKA